MKVQFKDTVAIAGEIKNNICYTKNALKKAATQIKELPFGVIYNSSELDKPRLIHAAFLIKDAVFDGAKLDVTIETLDGAPYGEAAAALISGSKDSMCLGMRSTTRHGEVLDSDNNVVVVDDLDCVTVSLLPKKDRV